MTDLTSVHLPLQTINVPKDNDARLIFTYQDQIGELLDLTGVQEITFAVFATRGGDLEFIKTLSDGDIIIHGNNYEFSLLVTNAETAAMTTRLAYHECLVVNSEGQQRTVCAGLFRAEDTYIGSIE
jgi:hypothetical protein